MLFCVCCALNIKVRDVLAGISSTMRGKSAGVLYCELQRVHEASDDPHGRISNLCGQREQKPNFVSPALLSYLNPMLVRRLSSAVRRYLISEAMWLL